MIQVKICGLTNEVDALYAAACGASALGFIFYPPSPRYINPEDARTIVTALPDDIVRVGVFVNEKAETVKNISDYLALDMIQLHGDESPEYCRQFPASTVIKAIELNNDDDIDLALDYEVAALLADTRHAGLYGGTGKKSNWEFARKIKNKKPLILSGGLNAENIADALTAVAPDALDINSGVESFPGKKDHEKLSRLFEIIRTHDPVVQHSRIIFQRGLYD
ncbi:MAG: phosphoribosylanthranilate isomerase [Smithella sp.]|nr:phosphoribosylanthranilate isomerase [Smithella sp.]